MANRVGLLHLPEVALEKIFSFLTYDEIAKNRIVCKKFNEVGSKLLSRGFIQLEKKHAAIYKRLKSLLPRRESERRLHPLSRHCDVLQAIETRISMLNMTYMKYIDCNLLCFIPGKVLDEMKHVLSLVESDHTPPRTHQLLQELRDLSSMAMEHFDEHILPGIKEQLNRREVFTCTSSPQSSRVPKLFYNYNLTNELHKVKKQSKTHKHHITFLTQSTQKLCDKLTKQNVRLKAQASKIREQERKIQEQTTKIQEQEASMAEIKKHIDEWDQKYKDLTTELIRAKDDILSAMSHSRPTSSSSLTPPPSASPPKVYKTNIRPRSSHIPHLLPRGSIGGGLQLDLDRKRKSNLLPEIPVKRNRDKDELTLNVPPFADAKRDSADPPPSDGNSPRFRSADIGSMISSSLENLLKSKLPNISSRKRKMTEDIDLK